MAGFLNHYFCVENIGKYFPLQIPFIKSVKELKRRGFRVHLPETFLYGIPFVFFAKSISRFTLTRNATQETSFGGIPRVITEQSNVNQMSCISPGEMKVSAQ